MVTLEKGVSLHKNARADQAYWKDLECKSDLLTRELKSNCLYSLKYTFDLMAKGMVEVR